MCDVEVSLEQSDRFDDGLGLAGTRRLASERVSKAIDGLEME